MMKYLVNQSQYSQVWFQHIGYRASENGKNFQWHAYLTYRKVFIRLAHCLAGLPTSASLFAASKEARRQKN